MEAKQILETYFAGLGITSQQVSVNCIRESETVSKNDVLDIIRSKVTLGIPVLYRGCTYSTNDNLTSASPKEKSGHLMVAYGLDGDDIKLHTGWTSNQYTTVNTTDYQYKTGALWLEINEDVFPHICSESFQELSTNKIMCSCQAYYTLHPSHTHTPLTIVANSYTSESHIAKCICGTLFEKAHKYTYKNLGNNHSCLCDCGYQITTAHNLVIISPKYMMCKDCGYMFDRISGGFIPNPLEDENKETLL